MKGIAELFAELSGYRQYDELLEQITVKRHASAVERVRLWRIQNPARWRAMKKAQHKRWRKKHPDKVRAARARQRAKRPEHYRELNRQHAAAYRARKRAAQGSRRA